MKTIEEKFKLLLPGTKILAEIENTTTTIIHKEEMVYTGKMFHHGYITECGAWSLYKIPGTVKKCFYVNFKKAGKIFSVALDFQLKNFKVINK